MPGGHLQVREVVVDVQELHTNVAHAGALLQVASQFNLLEMASPHVTMEQGVGIYAQDHTQGPACAVAAGAGTIYCNYFAPVHGHIGQAAAHQIDCLADLGAALGNTASRLWTMHNGYALATQRGLAEIAQRLRAASEGERGGLRQLLRIGIHWQTRVTLWDATHLVSQAYCFALRVAYTTHVARLWAPFAQLILEAPMRPHSVRRPAAGCNRVARQAGWSPSIRTKTPTQRGSGRATVTGKGSPFFFPVEAGRWDRGVSGLRVCVTLFLR